MSELVGVRCEVCGFEWDPRLRLLGDKGCPNAEDHPEVHALRSRLDAEHAAHLEAKAKLAEAVGVVKGFVGLVSWKDLNDPEFSDYQTALMKRAAALLERKGDAT